MKIKLKNMFKRAKKNRNVELHTRCRQLEKDIRRKLLASTKTRIRNEANLGPQNLWKAVRIAKSLSQGEIPPVRGMDGKLVETNEEKVKIFGEYFEQKIKNITNTTQPNLNQAEERKLINGRHEDNWITIENTKTIMANLPNKRCSGYDRITVIFYKDGMEILLPIVTDLMKKIFSEKRWI